MKYPTLNPSPKHQGGACRERLVFQPDASHSLRRGINLVVNAIRPTLGPNPRNVAVSQVMADKTPELLDKGGLIARRITDLPDRDADMGAMLVRGMLWQLYEETGDGTATAAVVFQSIYNDGLKYIVGGGDPMRLRHCLLQGLDVILRELEGSTQPVQGQEQLANLAESICHDRELAAKLGEIFDFIGEYGQLDVRRGHTRKMEHDYMKGMYWKRGAVSRGMLSGGKQPDRIVMNDAAILLSDLDIEEVSEVLPVIEVLIRAGAKSLLLIGNKFSEAVINFILANKNPEKFRLIAVKAPGSTADEQRIHLQDIAVMTGAIPLYKAAGDTLATVLTPPGQSSRIERRSYYGQAKQLWVERTMFGVVSERENHQELTEHLADLLELLEYTQDRDEEDFLRERIGKLLGGVAILRIGDAMPPLMDARIAQAKETAKSIRRALRHGVVPGGGVALLECRDALRQACATAVDSDALAACRILLNAIEEPIRTICHNAGLDSAAVARLEGAPSGYGIDLRTGSITHMAEAGIVDVASVLKAAMHRAVTSAALALTIDVLVHHDTPDTSFTP